MTMFHDVMSANILTLTLRQMCSLLETYRHFALDILSADMIYNFDRVHTNHMSFLTLGCDICSMMS